GNFSGRVGPGCPPNLIALKESEAYSAAGSRWIVSRRLNSTERLSNWASLACSLARNASGSFGIQSVAALAFDGAVQRQMAATKRQPTMKRRVLRRRNIDIQIGSRLDFRLFQRHALMLVIVAVVLH